jgi:hypothetical protein
MKQASLLHVGLLVSLLLDLEDGSDTFHEIVDDFRRLHDVISEKTELFIATSMKTSNPTQHYSYSNFFLKIKYMNKWLTRKGEKKREMEW